ncbi:nicotinic acid mononucleotide adenylyltransferase [Tetragenococcus koreensis]|uniref:Probable nicotinate-nucleotide adenylyltransferase n=2 Tax=Tetragenococcus koreensis TaxID=290335 RepID=A0AAN4RKX5_9ENTE|nr:putative nicotinate-nucleotide adenylyltransferase [Tetragenococcus koreensis]GEQ48197.1 nicotinic acid mononucleotide adenylyltransferase [Tetragenococcus koreensis]GEQ50734.1 nicotinic acid mononucleotide adenylyltransferase [Tetragenococcus koreensis]GEQ53205.1 nicotinic acid mononucleotide adenylyltransferase [Tetragenococcus koreensis]GEQ55735.1 nicotinic acid mononucleotide adenylyltransferase [Tetragenococcus koreensis]
MKQQVMSNVQTFVEVEKQTNSKRKQVGILGGTFNPVHMAHLIMADQVGTSLGLEKVYLMPSNEPPHVDHKETIDATHRLKMLELAIEDNPLLAIEKNELEREGKSYTYETMKVLTEKYPDTDFYFIIGGDMVDYLPTWYKIDELTQLVQFVGVKRPGFSTESSYPIIWIDVPDMNISSTDLRKKITQGCSVNYLLPKNVLHYIQEKGLYLDEK